MNNVLLIYNAVSGDASFRFALDRFIDTFSDQQWEVRIWRCDHSGSAANYLLHVDITDTKAVFVAGGNGTVSEVVNAFMKRGLSLPIGLIPAGTENDFAKKLGFDGDLEQNLNKLSKMHRIPVDVGKVNGVYFVDTVTVGTASTFNTVDSDMKNALGPLAVFIANINSWKKTKLRKFHFDVAEEAIENKFRYFIVSTENYAKQNNISKELLTLLASRHRSFGGETRFLHGFSGSTGSIRRGVHRYYGNEFLIDVEEKWKNIPVCVDGDPGLSFPLHISVIPGALTFFADESIVNV